VNVADMIIEAGVPRFGRLIGWLAPVAVAFVMGGRRPRARH
jgi:hypothetical protein